ncbi:hypothetical protein EWN97_002445 [Escherichia coli]|uniref:hypothetical protein n=1 Tax=Escherichia coli TaxID=562 RepID=UPI00044F1847|nr:hypothetical protein [Escherichia coli]EER5394442.1 hypothetical protein [Escherichia coli]EET7764112.1 hypothetical protein [Escherichia coli]EEU4686412.1 hypothetical protein [Escherichia coli]EEV0712225.1 hypothetical protein [Escherichia coli]EEV6494950.1 hypothetical protein [Escherichia coli]
MEKTQRDAAVAANRHKVSPEQVLIWCEQLKFIVDTANRNTRHNEKSRALEPIIAWIEQQKKQAMTEIRKRGE